MPYINMNQPQVYMWPLPPEPPSHVVIVSDEQRRDSGIHMHVAILPQTPLPHNIEQSPLSCTGPCWLSILSVAVCTCPSQTLVSSRILPCSNHKFIL